MIKAYIQITSENHLKRWQKYVENNITIKDNIILIEHKKSYYDFINHILTIDNQDSFLVCNEEAFWPNDFLNKVKDIIIEASLLYPNWGIISNAGISVDGYFTYCYVHNANGNYPIKSSYMKPVLTIHGHLMIINRKNVVSLDINIPNFNQKYGYDLVLSLACLYKGSLSLVDSRLLIYDDYLFHKNDFIKFTKNDEFQCYVKQYFINNQLISYYHQIKVKGQDLGYLFPLSTTEKRKDITNCFNEALAKSRIERKPKLTICCRTQLERKNLLTRAVISFASSLDYLNELLTLEVVIISDKDNEILAAEISNLKKLVPNLILKYLHCNIRLDRYSRTDLLLQSIDTIKTDYIWFVDDDDYIYPNALSDIGRHLSVSQKYLLIGDSLVIKEEWHSVNDGNSFLPKKHHIEKIYYGKNVFKIFQGKNHIPICSIIFPVKIMREQIKDMSLSGDFSEDYSLLMLAITAPDIELTILPIQISGISIRKEGNSVTSEDRTHWHYSYVNFFSELVNSSKTNSPIFWQMAVGYQNNYDTDSLSKYYSLLKLVARSLLRYRSLPYLIKKLYQIIKSQGFKKAIEKAINNS